MRRPLDSELAATQEMLNQARGNEIEVETVLAFAEDLLLNIAGVRQRCSLDQKQRLQQVVFPFFRRVSNTLMAFIELMKLASCSRG